MDWNLLFSPNIAVNQFNKKFILDIDSCQMKADYELPADNRYEFGSVGSHTWSDAQSLCQAKGEGWDLAIIDDYKGKY